LSLGNFKLQIRLVLTRLYLSTVLTKRSALTLSCESRVSPRQLLLQACIWFICKLVEMIPDPRAARSFLLSSRGSGEIWIVLLHKCAVIQRANCFGGGIERWFCHFNIGVAIFFISILAGWRRFARN